VTISQGDIVWLDTKFTDQSGNKERPILIISNESLNFYDDVIGLKITTTNSNDGYSFKIENSMLNGKLPKQCYVGISQVFTFDVSTFKPDKKISMKRSFLEDVIDKFQDLIIID
jgi:mRNA-degrading endonuclease toxin of MazEF toxin-antitoxin module